MSNNDSNYIASDFTIEDDVAIINNPEGGVSSVSVSITLSTKALGADAFIKLEETFEFGFLANDSAAVARRAEMVDILRDQVIMEAKGVVEAVREAVATTPKGSVSIHPVNAVSASGAQAGSVAPAFSGPQATVAVANGAAPAPAPGASGR
jgi:hypothetical protein